MFKTKWQKEVDEKLQDMSIKLAILIVKAEKLEKLNEKPSIEEMKAKIDEKYADYKTPDGKFTTREKAQAIKDSLISRN